MPYAPITDRFARACEVAVTVHGGAPRKGTDIPYLSHVMSASALKQVVAELERQTSAGGRNA